MQYSVSAYTISSSCIVHAGDKVLELAVAQLVNDEAVVKRLIIGLEAY
jgi:hypothetical protein